MQDEGWPRCCTICVGCFRAVDTVQFGRKLPKPNLLMLKEYRLGAFSCRGCGLFPDPDRSFPLLGEPSRTSTLTARSAARTNGDAGARHAVRTSRTARSNPEEPRGKRFSRADQDKNGRIEREELLAPRRKAFAKLDKNSDGKLAFEEWAVKTVGKFAGADKDRTGWLSPAEYASTAPPPPKKKRCSC